MPYGGWQPQAQLGDGWTCGSLKAEGFGEGGYAPARLGQVMVRKKP